MNGSSHLFEDFRSITLVLLLIIKVPCTDQKKKNGHQNKNIYQHTANKTTFLKFVLLTYTKCSPSII